MKRLVPADDSASIRLGILFFIHRLLAAIHLPASWISLFLMAGMHLVTVTYNIIAAQMETLHTINITRNGSNIRPGVRLALTATGIVAAIICLFTFLSEIRSSAVATAPHVIEASKIVTGDFSVKTIGITRISAMWPF